MIMIVDFGIIHLFLVFLQGIFAGGLNGFCQLDPVVFV